MLGDIATITLYLGTIVISIIGFFTPKYFIYGSIASSIFWLGIPLTPNVTRANAKAIIPYLLDLCTIPYFLGCYPEKSIFRTTF